MKKILLVDVDSKLPNLALMKLSTYEKTLGNSVEIKRLNLSGYPTKRKVKFVDASNYDKVYVSTIFTTNQKNYKITGNDLVSYGGTGLNLNTCLPSEIDGLEEDYSIYPENDTSYGFITRGCIRNCPFCFVPKKEGKIRKYRDWKDIVKHNKVEFFDNNFLAYKEHKKILSEFVESGLKYKFNQGLDIKLIDKENSKLISKSRFMGDIIFAFDDIRYKDVIEEKLKIFRKHFHRSWGTMFFIYCHPSMPISDTLYRIEWCRDHEALPYVMRDIACWSNGNRDFYTDLTSYCNQPSIFKKKNFEDFLNERYAYIPNHPRIGKSLTTWKEAEKYLS